MIDHPEKSIIKSVLPLVPQRNDTCPIAESTASSNSLVTAMQLPSLSVDSQRSPRKTNLATSHSASTLSAINARQHLIPTTLLTIPTTHRSTQLFANSHIVNANHPHHPSSYCILHPSLTKATYQPTTPITHQPSHLNNHSAATSNPSPYCKTVRPSPLTYIIPQSKTYLTSNPFTKRKAHHPITINPLRARIPDSNLPARAL